MSKPHEPKISIITPSYNQGVFIEQTILSVINQSYKNFELIIIDGGSNDNTVELIQKYQSHIFYWVSEKDDGQSHAINKGLQKTSGDIITWLNSDDYYEPDTLQIIVSEFLKTSDASIIHGKSILFGESVKSKVVGLTQDIGIHEYLSYMRFPQPSSFYKKEVIQAVGNLNTHLHYAMDFEWIVKAILLGFKIKRIDPILSHYRLHANSKSNNELKFLEEWSQVVYTVFNSFSDGQTYLKKMHDLSIVSNKSTTAYSCNVHFSEQQKEQIFLEHLHLYYHHHYRHFNFSICNKISVFLSHNYSNFYLQHNFKKYNFRMKFIPKFIFKLIKKVSD